MQKTSSSYTFQLSTGGLIYWLLIRIHAQAPDHYHTKRRILLFCTLTWVPLILLSAFEGNLINHEISISFISDLKPYVRYLVALPLLIVADILIDPLIVAIISNIGSSGIITGDNKSAFERAFKTLDRRNDSFVADIVIIGIAILSSSAFLANLNSLDVYSEQSTWIAILEGNQYHLTYAGWWFVFVSSLLLQIFLYRWLWRFFIWCEFLYRVSRINLALEPTHPDLAGGLGVLKNSQSAFIVLFLAFGCMLSVSLAQEILYSDATMAIARPVAAAFVASCLVINTLPLLFFSKQLILAKRRGRIIYGALGYKLSRAFDEKWGQAEDAKIGKNLLEVADASAVCDYSTVFEIVKNMRFIPVSGREYVIQAIILIAPFAPLVFLEMSFTEVLKRLFDTVI